MTEWRRAVGVLVAGSAGRLDMLDAVAVMLRVHAEQRRELNAALREGQQDAALAYADGRADALERGW